MNKNRLVISVAGNEILFETGKIAKQANGSVMLTCNDTVILSTACMSNNVVPDVDFLPLKIDYQEKFSAAGKTLGGFIKREGKPTEKEILTSRLIDRPIRPLFPDGFFHEVQILNYVLSYNSDHPPEALSICAASAALVISDIPFIKPLAAVNIGMIDGNFIINPTLDQQKKSVLDLVLAGTKDAVLMIEGYCKFLTEEQVVEAIEEGHKYVREICLKLEDWQNLVGKDKIIPDIITPSQELLSLIRESIEDKLKFAFQIKDRKCREKTISDIDHEITKHLLLIDGSVKYSKVEISKALKKIQSDILRKNLMTSKKRVDGRMPTDIRSISIETSILPRTHGSALFTRGETQTISVCTIGGESMGQRYEDLDGDGLRKFYLQYTFPPFSVGEVGRSGSPGRREVGHGKLAERALSAVIPTESDNFPYTIRLESNVTESNGSSSMASVCGCCLAMMDAGIPIKRPVAGIAMGLILEKESFLILSDIMGIEDSLGDMDFKITGDSDGITAFQMDIKVEGITPNIIRSALAQAKEGRIHILRNMLEVSPKSRQTLSKYAPRIETMKIKTSKIAIVIGPGGKQIRKIIDETGVEMDINDDGIINITSKNAKDIEAAKKIIRDLTTDIETGQIYDGYITNVLPFGIFVSMPGGQKDGLCHISELSNERIDCIEDYLEKHDIRKGDRIEVEIIEVNNRGQIKLKPTVIPSIKK